MSLNSIQIICDKYVLNGIRKMYIIYINLHRCKLFNLLLLT